ncbi:MAG: GNAT family N-acetyltransferase [Holophagae bacterium]|nr:GNAT family N-acetyltransferase [Holophagae bacterium]
MTPDEILPAVTPDLLREVRALFKEYASSLGIDLSFQDLAHEIEGLPGAYAAPDGALLVAKVQGKVAGCVGVCRFAGDVCEMKRLFVRHSFRNRGVGRRLAVASLDEARALGFRVMRLDTVPWMREALALYRSLGFVEIPPYRFSPVAGAVFLERELG